MKMFYKEMSFEKTSIGRFPKDWEIVELGKIANVKGGKRLPKGEKLVDFNTGFPYIRVVDFKNGTVDISGIKYLLPETHEKIKNYTISSDDVYISIAGTIGLAGLIPKELDGANLTENAAKLCNLKEAKKEFLAYLLNSEALKDQIIGLMGKGTQPKLALFRIKSLRLPLPSLKEQEIISEVLGVVDSVIGLVDRVILKTERLKKGLMQTLLTRGIGHKEYKQTLIGTIPKDWELVKIKELGELQYGYTTSAIQEDTGVKFLRITDIQEDGSVDWEQVPYCHIEDDEFDKYALHKGDLLFARIGATAGKTTYIHHDIKGVFASYLIRLKIIRENIHPDFVFYFTQSAAYWSQALRQREGQLKKGINATMLSDFTVPLPPLEEQQKIAEILFSIDQRLNLERREKARLERVKQSLMDLLLTGKIRVKVD